MATGGVELHHTPLMRFGGGPNLQVFCVLAVVVWTIFAIDNHEPLFLIIAAVGLIGWVFGATAWIRIDDAGVHRRCYLRHWVAPASGRSKHVEQFAHQLVIAARAKGVDVSTSGWRGFDT